MARFRSLHTYFPKLALTLCVLGAASFTLAQDQSASLQRPSFPTAHAQAEAPALPTIPDPNASAFELEREGDQLRAAKRYLDSLDFYNAAIAKQPSASAWNKKGMAYLFMMRNGDADKCFRQAIKLDKNAPEAYNNRGFVAQTKKEYGQAIKFYKHAMELRPQSSTFHYNLGSAYFGKHEYQLAVTEYRTAFQLDPDIFQRVSKTGIMAQNGSPEDRAAFNFMIAKMYAQNGDLDHCLQYLRKAMEEGYSGINKVYTDTEFATLRTDKRFNELMLQKPQSLQ